MPPSFRTPAHAPFTEALGQCLWNFLYLEEVIVRQMSILHPEQGLSTWRALTAVEKGKALGRAVKQRDPRLPSDLRKQYRAWITDFQEAAVETRNALAHGHAFTESVGADGRWLPGLAYTDATGKHSVTARSPDDLYAIAKRADDLMGRLYELERALSEAGVPLLASGVVRKQLNPGSAQIASGEQS